MSDNINLKNFRCKMNLKNYPNLNLDSIINAPVIYNSKVVGVITNYYLDSDEAVGTIFDDSFLSCHILNNNIISFEIYPISKEELKRTTYNAE